MDKLAVINDQQQQVVKAAKARADLVCLRAGDTLRATDLVVFGSGLQEVGGTSEGHEITESGPGYPQGYYFRRTNPEPLPTARSEPNRCPHCSQGLPVLMLDFDGVNSRISGVPGFPCHAADDMWWVCANAHPDIKRLYEGMKDYEAKRRAAELESFPPRKEII